MVFRWLAYLFSLLLGVALIGAILLGFVAILAYPNLPSLEVLTDYQPKIPLRVFSSEGELIGEFGEERRALVKIGAVPLSMRQAILAAEDERFYKHGGVDYVGVLRAAYSNLASGGKRQGASTITMQVARNFFLSSEKTLTRKLNEALLAFKIERSLSKDDIFQLYVNQIYLGQRAYGFAAAAQIYFGKPLEKLSFAEEAMLAGLPKAPSAYNPVINPKRAKMRQMYVLRRMRELNFLTEPQYQAAQIEPLHVKRDLHEFALRADYVAEMARQVVFDSYGEDAYTKGLRVYTTIRRLDQEAAYSSLRKGVLDYDRRHGYRGPEGFIDLPTGSNEEVLEELDDALLDIDESDDLLAAVVLEASAKHVKAYRQGGESVEVTGEGLKFVQKALGEKVAPNLRIRPGALIRVQKDEKGAWQVVQQPQAEAAFVSVNPQDGAIRSLIGGFDFARSKFNHVTQAYRQPGSSFKPFIYSAALDKGFTPATIVNDAPLIFDAGQTGSEPWEPKNYDGKFSGPIRLRYALAHSKNLASIRVLQAIGATYAQEFITRFGFDPKLHPAYLTMVLGAGSATPMQMVAAYSVFANGGYRISPYLIDRIQDARGTVLTKAQPVKAADGAERVIDERNAYLMTSMMQDVIRSGTATKAMQLGRQDLAGKTGTTNEQVDAWFTGYQATVVAVSWIGFDKPRTLGSGETGAQAALPMWISYMGKVLKGVPEQVPAVPEGVIAAKINPGNGLPDAGNGVTDYFYQENQPRERSESFGVPSSGGGGGSTAPKPADEVKNQLF